jgi:RNA polymerase sigma factor (TIGR02999 family)
MSPEDSGSVTNLLARFHRGDPTVEARLLTLVRDELHRLAVSYMRRERPDHTLQPTALIHEAYIRLVSQGSKPWKNRSHFLAVAALLMRQILVDHARARLAGKRGKRAVHVSIDDSDVGDLLIRDREQAEDVIALHDALNKLETIDPRQSRILHLRFFGGLSVKEAAKVLEISERTANRLEASAREWMANYMRALA